MTVTMQCATGPCQVSLLGLFAMTVLIIAAVGVAVSPLIPALTWVGYRGGRAALVFGLFLFVYAPIFAIVMTVYGVPFLVWLTGVPW